MARAPKKKSEPRPSASAAGSVLPMQLRVGDRITDERGEWEIVVHPYTTGGGKAVHARVQKVGEPAVVEERAWGAHERITVQRA